MATVTYSWSAATGPITVNDLVTTGNQGDVAIAAAGDSFVAAWTDPAEGRTVYARAIHADGTAEGSQTQVNTFAQDAPNGQFDPAVATLTNGNAVVSFTSFSTISSHNIVMARLFGAGIPAGDISLNPQATARETDVAARSGGGFAMAYTVDNGGGNTELLMSLCASTGSPTGGIVVVDSDDSIATSHASVARLATGNLLVAWEQTPVGGGAQSVWFQQYTNDGDALTVPGDPAGSHHLMDLTGTINRDIQVAALTDGGFIVAYTDNGWGASTDISAQVFNLDGTARTNTFRVNGATAGDQSRPSVTALTNGFFVVGWSDGASFYQQAYTGNGVAAGSAYQAAGSVVEAEIAGLTAGLVANLRESTATDGSGTSIRSHVTELTRTITGDDFTETLLGDDLRDTLRGNGANDVLRGGGGADVLDGGAGNDTADYNEGTVAVMVDLGAGTATGGHAEGDVLTGIEHLTGTIRDDRLTGGGGVNRLRGSLGNDVLRGGAGADTLDGDTGTDVAMYSEGGIGITVNLGAGQGFGGNAEGDILFSIEGVYGSSAADSLIGDAGANTLAGNGGNDQLLGGGGGDVLSGDAGKDTLTGGAGADRFALAATADSPVGAFADRITDFSHAQGDRIDLSKIDANTTVAGNQAFSFIGSALYSGVAGQLRAAVNGGTTTVAGDVNGDGVSDFHIVLTGPVALVAADFVL
jgi:Ca2+-binding RTX toxin-like protein